MPCFPILIIQTLPLQSCKRVAVNWSLDLLLLHPKPHQQKKGTPSFSFCDYVVNTSEITRERVNRGRKFWNLIHLNYTFRPLHSHWRRMKGIKKGKTRGSWSAAVLGVSWSWYMKFSIEVDMFRCSSSTSWQMRMMERSGDWTPIPTTNFENFNVKVNLANHSYQLAYHYH